MAAVSFTADDYTYAFYRGKLVFLGDTGGDKRLWISDGSAGGTHLLHASGPTLTGIYQLTAGKDGLIFAASDGVTGAEPWIYQEESFNYLPFIRR